MKEKYLIDQLIKADHNYEMFVLPQGFWSSSLKKLLDENVIFNNGEYIELTKQLAISFNEYFQASVERKKAFLHYHSESSIMKEWELYMEILKGLPVDIIESLDETGWNHAVYYQKRFFDNDKFRTEFLNNRKKSRVKLRKYQKDQ